MQSTLVFFSVGSILSTLVTASPLSSIRSRAVDIPGYDSIGCYTEATGMRALTGHVTYSDAMTIELCAASCAGYTWFGVEYGRECFCGDTLNPGSKQVPSAACSFPCPGNAAEKCGAGDHLTMYAKTGTVEPSSGTPAKYGGLGCYTESTTGRALSGAVSSGDDMTVEKCAANCDGFSKFGLEYGRECYCGNELGAGSEKAIETKCFYACAGNDEQGCGGDWHMRLYEFGADDVPQTAPVTTYARQGCYTEIKQGRALSEKTYFNELMTVEKCGTACTGYALFGVEYGRECFCGNTLDDKSKLVDDSECNYECPGDSSEKCGAGDRIDLYKFGATTPTSSSESASITDSPSSSSTMSETPASTTSEAASSSSSDSPIPSITTTSEEPSSSSTTTSEIQSTTSESPIPSSTTTSDVPSSSSTTTSESPSPTPAPPVSSSTTSDAVSSSTTPAINPTPSGRVVLTGSNLGARLGRSVNVLSKNVVYDYQNNGAFVPLAFIRAGGQPFYSSDPTIKLYLHSASSYVGVLYFETAAEAAFNNDPSVSCSMDAAGIISCLANNPQHFNTIYNCGAYLYMAKLNEPQIAGFGCVIVNLKFA